MDVKILPNYLIHSFFVLISLIVAFILLKTLKYPEKQNEVNKKYIFSVLLIGALIGVKLPIIISYGWHKEFLLTGKSYYGAIIGAFFAINIYKSIYKIKGNFGDRFVIPLCVSAGIGKIGCFFYGCCSGSQTEFFLKIKNYAGVYVQPVQLYEAFFEFLCAILFFILYKSKRFEGSHFLIYMLLYIVFRFYIEFIRIEPKIMFGFSVYQLMSIIFIPLFAVMLYRRLKNAL